jgi:hypothetical protein
MLAAIAARANEVRTSSEIEQREALRVEPCVDRCA